MSKRKAKSKKGRASRKDEPSVNSETAPELTKELADAPCSSTLPESNLIEIDSYASVTPKQEIPSESRVYVIDSISKPSPPAFSPKLTLPDTQEGKMLPASKSGHEEDRVALIRAPRAETNLGKNPESRRYIRGVLHSHPWSLRMGAVFSLLLLLNLPFAIVSGFLLLSSVEFPALFSWVPRWLIAFPITLPLIALCYLIWSMSGKCIVCRQKLFVHKGALKHVKAHRFPGLGFVVPLSLHLLAFHWFRCSSCGTPLRLKK